MSSAAANYHGAPVLIDVAPKDTYHLSVFPLTYTNAWVAVARTLGQQGSPKQKILAATNQLSHFFSSVSTLNVYGFLNLVEEKNQPEFETSSVYWSMPLELALAPWSDTPLSLGEPINQLDPSRAADDVARIESVRKSVLGKGYKRGNLPDGDIEVEALIGPDGSERYHLISGNHRAAVLTSIGQESLPVRVISVVRREDVDVWPKVRSGVFSRDQALSHFDQYFTEFRDPQKKG